MGLEAIIEQRDERISKCGLAGSKGQELNDLERAERPSQPISIAPERIPAQEHSEQASELATIGALIVWMAGDDVHSKNRASG
jgi:hypothetical protein